MVQPKQAGRMGGLQVAREPVRARPLPAPVVGPASDHHRRAVMDPLLCFPAPSPAELALALERAGYPWKAVARPEHAATDEPDDGWAGAVVSAETDAQGAFALCRAVRTGEVPLRPLLLVVTREQLVDLHLREDHFDDF